MSKWFYMSLVAFGLFTPNARGEETKPAEVTVRAAPRKRDPGRSTVRADDARRVAGTRDDALRIVESLPGVARNAFFGAGGVVLWGSAPGDSRILVDGVEIPALYHNGGLRGVLPTALVQTIDLTPGAYGADYGRALGGLVRVTTKELPREGVHASLGADFLDASGTISAAIGDRVRFGGAARLSYLDKLANAVVSPDTLGAAPIPRYHDMQLKSSLALRENEEISAVLLNAGDSFTRTQGSSDPANIRRESTTNSFYRYYLHYTHTLDDGAHVIVTPFWGYDQTHREASFGGNPQIRETRTYRYGLRSSYRVPLTSKLNATMGVDAQATQSALFRQGSLTLPPREGDDYVFGQTPARDVNADSWNADIVDVAPFAFAEWRLGPLLLTPGLRGDVFLVETSRQTPRIGQTPSIGRSELLPAVDPRLSAHLTAGKNSSFSLSGGIYHQPPAPEDLSAVFGTPKLRLSRAFHASLGSAAHLPLGIDIESSAFYVAQDKLVVRSRLPTPTLAQALTQDGQGRNYGLQILVRRQLANGWYGWVAYTASRSERRYQGQTKYRLFDQDQSHVLTATGGYEWHGWSFGVRFRYATGSPRTPVEGSYFNVSSGGFEPIFGAYNGIRLPSFIALDARVQKTFVVKNLRVIAYVDGTNLTNHANAEDIIYNFDYSRHGYLFGLPALVLAGARIEL